MDDTISRSILSRPQLTEATLPSFIPLIKKLAQRQSKERFEDITQQVLMRTFIALRNGTIINHPRTYFSMLARNQARDLWRSDRRTKNIVPGHGTKAEEQISVLDMIEKMEQIQRIRRVISTLSPEYQTIIQLHIDGHEDREIARMLQYTPVRVRVALHRIRSTLIRHFNDIPLGTTLKSLKKKPRKRVRIRIMRRK